MSMRPTHAMVLAAGFGKRMRPLTDDCPKPLIEVKGKALIDYALDNLQRAGVQQVVVNTAYLPKMIHQHLRGRKSPEIEFSDEIDNEPLETGGGIAKALPMLGEAPFYSMNSDTILVDDDAASLRQLARLWEDSLDALLLLHPVEKAIGYEGKGDFVLRDDGCFRRRQEDDVENIYVFTGVQLLHPRLFSQCPQGAFSLNVLYNQRLGADGYFQQMRAIIHEGDWLHVGDPQGLALANEYFS